MDADDISPPKRLEYQINYILKNKYELVGCHYKRMNANKKIYEENLAPLNNFYFFIHLLIGSPFAHGSIIFNKNILKKKIDYTTINKKFSIFPEDYNFYLKCWYENVKIGTVNKFLYFHRYHNASYSMVNKKIYNLNLKKTRDVFFLNNFFKINNIFKKKLILKNIYIKVILFKLILIFGSKLSYNTFTNILYLFKAYDLFLIFKYFCKRKIMKFIYA
jgi:hypothetical protein